MTPVIKTLLDPFVLVTAENGVSRIPQPTPLKRLHYFDGKFLRAEDLTVEQQYMRALVHLSNQAGGTGVVHGLDTTLSGDDLRIGPGMAIDPAGRILLVPGGDYHFDLDDLIERSARRVVPPKYRFLGPGSFEDCMVVNEAPAARPVAGTSFYVITVGHAEALCGQEDVYGKICEEACVTSTDRPYRLEGIVVRAVPLVLTAALPESSVVILTDRHLQSRVASAVFAYDVEMQSTLISGAGLHSNAWCLGARLGSGSDVPLAVVARAGTSTIFFDAWTVRRERIEPPPRRYWAQRMSMRPWDVFLAQVLQFQCQLHELFDVGDRPVFDPCRDVREAAQDAANLIGEFTTVVRTPSILNVLRAHAAAAGPEIAERLPLSATKLSNLHLKIDTALRRRVIVRRHGVLIDGGIVELPPAGYLPIDQGAIVNDHAAAMFGPGVDFRVCRVTPDFVPHALEEAQHMMRISLLEGLESGRRKPQVDVLVPDGEVVVSQPAPTGVGFEGTLHVRPTLPSAAAPAAGPASTETATISPSGTGGRERFVGATRSALGTEGRERLVEAVMSSSGTGVGDRIIEEAAMRVLTSAERAGYVIKRPTESVLAADGAGRGERTESGGGGFYFAATTQVSNKVKVHDLAKTLVAIGNEDQVDQFRELARFPKTKAIDQLKAGEGALYLKSNLLGARAAVYTNTVRGAIAAGDDEAAAIKKLRPFETQTTATEDRLISAFLALRSDRNLFAEPVGRSSRVELHIAVGVPGKPPTWVEFRVQGDLTFSAIQPFGSVIKAKGKIQGGLSWTRASIEGRPPVESFDTSPIDVACTLEREIARQKLVVAMRVGRRFFRVELTWTENPLAAHAEVYYEIKGLLAEVLVASGDVTHNDAVLAAGHPRHAMAVSAINILAALLKHPDFAEQALALLFPPAPPAPKEFRLRAKHDWIFFHRRRVKECGEVAPRPEPAPPRTYAVFQAQVPDVATAQKIRQALLNNQTQGLPKTLRHVGLVRFAGGTPVLQTDLADLRQDWTGAGAGNILQWALIASQGTLDGALLARARLDAFEASLTAPPPLLTIDPQAADDLLASVPAPLAVPDTDGAIFVLTRTKVETTRHLVMWVEPHLREMFLSQAEAGDFNGLITGSRITHVVGTLEFAGDSAQFVTDAAERQQVRSVYDALPGGIPDAVFGFARASDAVASVQPALKDRVTAISTLLGGDNKTKITATAVPATLPPEVGAVTFVVPRFTVHHAFFVRLSAEGPTRTRLEGLLMNRDLSGLVKDDSVVDMGGAEFDGGSAHQYGTGSISELATKVPGYVATNAFVFGQPNHRLVEPVDIQKAQGEAIMADMQSANTPVVAGGAVAATWPSPNVHHVTIVLGAFVPRMMTFDPNG